MSKYIYCPLSLPGPRPFSRPPPLRAVFLSAATAACQPPLLPLSYGYYPLVRTRRAQLCEKCSLSSLPPSLSLPLLFFPSVCRSSRACRDASSSRDEGAFGSSGLTVGAIRASGSRLASCRSSRERERERDGAFLPRSGLRLCRTARRVGKPREDRPFAETPLEGRGRSPSRQPGSREVNLEVILWASAGRRYPPDTRRPARAAVFSCNGRLRVFMRPICISIQPPSGIGGAPSPSRGRDLT